MKLRRFYAKGKHDGWPFDRQKKLYFTWGFDIIAGGKRYQERGFLTKDHAEEVAIKIKADAKNRRHHIRTPEDEPTLFAVLQKKLDTMEPGRERTRAKRVFTLFLSLIPDGHSEGFKITDLRAKDFQAFMELRKSEGVSDETIRRELVPLSSALHEAPKHFEALESYRPPVIHRPKRSKSFRDKTISFEEQNMILSYLNRPRQPGESQRYAEIRHAAADFLQFSLLTGARVGEIAKLTKADVDLFAMQLRIFHSKTKHQANAISLIAITPTMANILLRRYSDFDREYIFTENGQVTPAMYKALREACEHCGAKYGRHDLDGITFSRTRHTAITDMVKSGIDLKTIGSITGHSDTSMTLRYAHTGYEEIRKAQAVLELNRGGSEFENIADSDTFSDTLPC